MADFPTSAEIEKIQDELKVLHDKMHAYAMIYPNHHYTFIGAAVDMTDALWKLDDIVGRAKFVESKNAPPKPTCHWSCTGCASCGSAGHGNSWF